MAKKRIMKKWRFLWVLIIIMAGIQFVRPELGNPPVTDDIQAPEAVGHILRQSCYNCHSNETRLKWFDEFAPAYWIVASDVKHARKALNFSEWDKLTPPQQKAILYMSLNQILFKEMPLWQYTLLHPEAKLEESDIAVLKNYLTVLSAYKTSDTAHRNADNRQYNKWMLNHTAPVNVPSAPNGIAYIHGYNNWKVISTTERFDNGIMHVIFGNDIALKVIEDGNINPWPDGTTFAKAGWDMLVDSSGIIHTGAFKQVEFMIKNSKKYASTKGWGWARWLGMQLKPYGKDASFSKECQNCHQPMKDNDFVFTMPLKLKAK